MTRHNHLQAKILVLPMTVITDAHNVKKTLEEGSNKIRRNCNGKVANDSV